MEKILIRRAAEGDAEEILALDKRCRSDLCAPSYKPGTYDRWYETVTASDYLESIAYSYKSFVAMRNGEIIGYAYVKDDDLQNICVHPSFLREGIGSALFRAIEIAVLAEGFTKITLLATLNSQPFFHAMNCILIKTRQLTLVEDNLIDVVLFEKRLLKMDSQQGVTGRFVRENS